MVPTDPFGELKPALSPDQALAEAHRCLMCFDAPCTRACPTHIDVPAFIKKIATGNLRGSARTILEANILGASCARVCPVEVLCEGACVMNDLHHHPIAIGRLQRHATEWVLERQERLFRPGLRRAGRPPVAIVGAGPAGLSCAAELAQLGYDATVFEAGDRPGGLNTTGVAEYKLTAATALREIEWVKQLGVDIRTGVRVGEKGGPSFAELEQKYGAVFLGVGLGKIQPLGIPGEELPGVWDALELIALLKADRAAAAGRIGRRVVVIGGGNTAIDAVTQAVRLGAEEVTLAYRRRPEDMAAYAHEVELAKHDGVRFVFLARPLRVAGKERAEGLVCERVRTTGRTDAGGRPALETIPGSEFTLPADTVVRATGQVARTELFRAVPGLLLEGGRPVHDPLTMQTGNPRTFVGGDCANGGAEVVNAVAEGKRAARGIHRYLEGNGHG